MTRTRKTGKERRISTPIVLVLTSAMLSIGIVAIIFGTTAPPTQTRDSEATPPPLHIDTSTAEHAAESFLDAWRKRRFDEALVISRGEARAAVERRVAVDQALSPEERDLQPIWDALADSRLHLELNESVRMAQGKIVLRGVVAGTLVDRPYRREMEFLVAPDGNRWVVEQMVPGRILTELPDILNVKTPPERDPGKMQPRGQDIP